MYIVYGIPNCDTVKKTLDWLKENNIAYEFHDYKKSGITSAKLNAWIKQAGLEKVLNKKSSTWRELDKTTQESITTAKKAVAAMQEKTSMIKRPVIERDNEVIAVGFEKVLYEKLFVK